MDVPAGMGTFQGDPVPLPAVGPMATIGGSSSAATRRALLPAGVLPVAPAAPGARSDDLGEDLHGLHIVPRANVKLKLAGILCKATCKPIRQQHVVSCIQ